MFDDIKVGKDVQQIEIRREWTDQKVVLKSRAIILIECM